MSQKIVAIAVLAALPLCLGATTPVVDANATAAAECGLNNGQLLALRKRLKAISTTAQTQNFEDFKTGKPYVSTTTTFGFAPKDARPFGFAVGEFEIIETSDTISKEVSVAVAGTVVGTYAEVRKAMLIRAKASECRNEIDDESTRRCRVDMGGEEYDRTLKLSQSNDAGAWGSLYFYCSP